jgi:very-short-patch-repair endonuclease
VTQAQTSKERGEVLVAIMNDPADFAIAQERQWYRIPVNSAPKRWPPQWLAFYQTKIFSEEKYSIKHFASVRKIQTATRQELFPDEPQNEKSSRTYYQLMLEPLQTLSTPIISQRWRRIVFIPTTWEKFIQATEINDLYDESPLEDRLWAELKQLLLLAERQYYLQVENQIFCLDFALFCRNGKLNIETDGDTWHSSRDRIEEDNLRDNYITTAGWHILRFNSTQINNQLIKYCIPMIVKAIKRFGGLDKTLISTTPVREYVVRDQILQLELFERHFKQEPEEVFRSSPKDTTAPYGKSGKSTRPRKSINKTDQAELFEDMPKSMPRRKRKLGK